MTIAKPKLLVLASTYPVPTKTYEPRFIADYCQQMSQHYAVTVLTQSRKDGSTRETDGQVRVLRYRYAIKRFELLSENGGIAGSLNANPLLFVVVPFMLSSLVFHLIYLLRKEKPEIIHAHWIFPQAFCVSIAQFIARTKIPVVCTSHGGDLFGLKGRFFYQIKKWTLNQIQSFAVVSTAMERYVRQAFPEFQKPIHVLPMGVDLKEKFSTTTVQRYSDYSLLFVGRIVKKKGLKQLIYCLDHLLKTNPNYRLTIAGDGPEKSEIEQQVRSLGIEHAVEFLGGVESKQLPDLYRSASLAIFPFIQAQDGDMEGLGLVIIEAMGCSCPVIVGDVPAIHDVVKDGETGIIGNPLDVADFSRLIDKAATEKDVTEKLSSNALKFVTTTFSWETCAEKYHQLFKVL